ncbi:DUF2000 domain-containing protein [Candidatus Woesearchaeota archaeon]|nr:DUF2000 domain-containing protein [Candidatus Woesearchaeota archaeon]
MEFTPFKHKLVAVLNEKIETGRVMNALAHMALGIGGSVEKEKLRLQDYHDASGGVHPAISDIPFIVLKANSSQIKMLKRLVCEQGIEHTDFIHTMIDKTYVEQHEKTQQTKEEDLEYWGICLFGDWSTVSTLTKKFSLWR